MTAQSIIECVELEMYINDHALTQSLPGFGEQNRAQQKFIAITWLKMYERNTDKNKNERCFEDA